MAAETEARRGKISVSVDPALLQEVDAFIRQHPRITRSAVIDQALRLWRLRRLEEALLLQYSTPLTPAQQEEQATWDAIHRAAAQRVLRHADDCPG